MTSPPDSTDGVSPLREMFLTSHQWQRTFVIGMCMGAADAVPGVSGGTIALIAGIYERLISAVRSITVTRVKHLVLALTPICGNVSGQRARVIAREIDAWFIISLVAGISTALAVVTRIVHIASQKTPVLLFGFFFGLIAVSAFILIRALSIQTTFQIIVGVFGFLLSFILSSGMTILSGGGLIVLFVAGSISGSAMILPGISGSLLLVILGQYTRMSTLLSKFVDSLFLLAVGGSFTQVTGPVTEILTFVLGGLIGISLVSRAVRLSLDINRQATLTFLVAMVIGALRAPVQRVQEGIGFSRPVLFTFLMAGIIGAFILLLLDWYLIELDFETV